MLSKQLKTEDSFTAIQQSTICESLSYGQYILNEALNLTMSQWLWHSLKSQDLSNLNTIKIAYSTHVRTYPSLENSPVKIGLTLTLTRAAKGVWCDYCKVRFGVSSFKGQKPAVWTIKSETPSRKHLVRSYCQDCTNEIQSWPDGSTWTLKEQIDYATGKQELDVQPE